MSFVKIEELINDLIKKVDKLSTNENLEAVAAKIIKEVLDKKKDDQPLMLNKHKEQISDEKRRFQKYSFPNFNVGNPSLGSSKSPNALKWPFGSTSND